jgi:ferredoxin
MPVQSLPPPPGAWWPWVDAGLLVIAMLVAAYLVHRLRRRGAVLVLTAVCLLYFGFVRKGCVCPVGAVQNVVHALADPGYLLHAAVLIVFLMPLAFALWYGRVFCAGVCPLGAIQDLVLIRPVTVPAALERVLRFVPFVYLGLAVFYAALGAGYVICRFDPFVGLFRLSASSGMLVVGGAMLVLGMFVGRPYCRFLCPYGAILSVFSRVVRHRLSTTPDECVVCGLCHEACPFGAILPPAEEGKPKRGTAAGLLVIVLLTTGGGAVLGHRAGPALLWWHADVALARQVEQNPGLDDDSFELEAFRQAGRSQAELAESVQGLLDRARPAGAGLGAFLGLALSLCLGAVRVPAERQRYSIHQGWCLDCARCFHSCPRERLRLGETLDAADLETVSLDGPAEGGQGL